MHRLFLNRKTHSKAHDGPLAIRWRRLVSWALTIFVLATGTLVVLASLRPDLGEKLADGPAPSVLVVDRHGQRLAELASERGDFHRPVALDHVSPHLVLATLSSEDAHFYVHPGIDPIGIARALWLDVRAGRLAYGGSTITQQLAKLLARQPRTLLGKALEALDALRLEWDLDKDAILEAYLNRAHYGRGATGIEAAARRFFGKPASDVTLGEAALLASLPRAPTAYDPERHPERVRRRRAHVLATMAGRGLITSAEAERAAAEPIRLAKPESAIEARHVVDFIIEQRPNSPEVATTVDLDLQTAVERLAIDHVAALADRAVDQVGVVVLDNRSSDVLAMVGSRGYDDRELHGAVNVTTALRAPGSTLKPFVYALALEEGRTAASPVLDVPILRDDYRPRSGFGHHHGLVSYRAALGSSLNVPAVRVAEAVGTERVHALLGNLGLDVPEHQRGLALALGGTSTRLVDLAAAYATLARGGLYRPWRLTADAPPRDATRILSPGTAFVVTDMLSDASARRLAFGIETPLDLPFPVAAKTGTSQSFCDNLTVGYTRDVTVAVWVGNFDGRPMHAMIAMQGAAPLFRSVMAFVMAGRAALPFERPADVHDVEVCPLSGLRRGPHCPSGRLEPVGDQTGLRPCDFHGPDGTTLPAELLAHERHGAPASDAPVESGLGPIRALPTGAPLTILSPRDGERYVIDPLVPRHTQALLLRALPSDERIVAVQWLIDGRPVRAEGAGTGQRPAAMLASSDPGRPQWWELEPGRHVIVAIAIITSGARRQTVRSEPTTIFVEDSST